MLKGLPTEHGARAAFTVGGSYARAGQWELAREVFELMTARYPAHPLSAEAYRWLARYACSGEARHRRELGQGIRQGVLSDDAGDAVEQRHEHSQILETAVDPLAVERKDGVGRVAK